MSVDGHYPVLKMFPLGGERRELIDVFDEVMPLSSQLTITTELKCDFWRLLVLVKNLLKPLEAG